MYWFFHSRASRKRPKSPVTTPGISPMPVASMRIQAMVT